MRSRRKTGLPWREQSVVEERLRFVVTASRREQPFGELCREFGVSRQTGYTWLKRYESGGSSQVVDRSRRPLRSPSRTSPEIEQAVVELRQRWPDWGAPKLHKLLLSVRPQTGRITVRTVHRILERHHMIQDEERHRPALKRFERVAPNQLWQMDFKGPPGFNRGAPVGPLSILDDHSRYVLALNQVGSTQMQGVRRCLQQTFEECGLPEAMLMDHGTPWWNAASPWGWTELGVWIMRQGIRLSFSGVRHPQTQGKVERMHGALQRAVRKRCTDLLDQSWLDRFRHEYNHVRPHAALAMETPASRWRPSVRAFQSQPREWEYPAGLQVVRLAGEGQLSWRGRRWEISKALRRQWVGLELLGQRAIVYFCSTPLRELDPVAGTSFPIPADVPRAISAAGERASSAGPFPPPNPASTCQGCPVQECQPSPVT
jgi:transposase InsO family protein